MENASRAFVDAVRKSMRQIRAAVGTSTINPDLLTAAERIQDEGYLHREETNGVIRELAKTGVTIKDIVRRTGYSRGLVRRVLRGQRSLAEAREIAAITSPWSNGQTEGQITKLKLVKRQMYGRGKLDLLEARLVAP